MSRAEPLLQGWRSAIARGAVQADAGQLAALERLDELQGCLNGRGGAKLARLLGRWTGRHPGDCRGIYLWGGVGRGKTWMMDRFQSGLTLPSRRLHFQHLMRSVHTRLHALRSREDPLRAVAAQYAREAAVLCIDELQVQEIGDAMLLHGLFGGLLERGVVLVITSNQSPRELYAGGLQRARFLPAIELLEARLDVVEVGPGPDYRMRQLAGSDTWFDATSPGAPAHMTALFEGMAGGSQSAGPCVLRIQSRPLPALRTASGMAWFDFSVLCGGPRSAHDYIALAEELHTLFLSGIPVMGADQDDAARRFISLIDELYDRRVNLVASAMAAPAELYRGERLRESFRRTVSRLVEMRGGEYLSAAHQGSRERA